MRVVETGTAGSLKLIASDDRVADILDDVTRHPTLTGLVFQIVRRFHTLDELVNGKAGNGGNLGRVVADYATRRRERQAKDRIGRCVYGLYRDYAPGEGNVRGALLEAFVERQLRSRYGGSDDLLTNNIQFRLENGVLYDSADKSIDVIGFDGTRGECHDCKVNAQRFDKGWVDELMDEVAPHGFMIGLATADYVAAARRKLADKGLRLHRAQLITPEQLHRLAPLQP